VRRVDVGGGQGLGHAVALEVVEAGAFAQPGRDGGGHGRAAAAHHLQAGEVEVVEPRVGEQVDHHGRDGLQHRAAPARDAAQRGLAVPAREHDEGGAEVQRAVHAAGQAGDVEEGQHRQVDRVLRAAEPLHAADEGAHRAAVGVHAAFGAAGRARGVGHDAEVVGAGGERAGAPVLREGIAPGGEAGAVQGHGRGGDEVGHRQVGGLAQGVGVGDDEEVAQAVAEQGTHLRQQVLRHDGDAGLAVVDAVAQLLAAVHRVDRHHDRAGAQDGVEGGDPLRAVLQVEQDAVAGLHAGMLQPAGDALAVGQQFVVAHRGVVEHDGRLVGEAPGRDGEVVEDVGLRQREVARQAGRPVGEVGLLHGAGRRGLLLRGRREAGDAVDARSGSAGL